MLGEIGPRLRAIAANAALRVLGGGAGRVLYQDANQNLAAAPLLTFDGSTLSNPNYLGSFSERFGALASTGGSGTSVAVGYTAKSTGGAGVTVGYGGDDSGAAGCTLVGYNAWSGGASNVAVVAIGCLAQATGPNQFVSGSTVAPINTVVFQADTSGLTLAPRVQSSTATLRNAGKVAFTLPTGTDASRKGRVTVSACDFSGTDRECFRGESDGTQALVGFYGATAVAKAASPGAASGTDAAVINAVITALRNLGLVT